MVYFVVSDIWVDYTTLLSKNQIYEKIFKIYICMLLSIVIGGCSNNQDVEPTANPFDR